jgi:O-antigen/teichoic acid export membrane protein
VTGTTSERPRLGSQQSPTAASSLAVLGAIITTAANFVIAYLVSRSGGSLAGVFWSATAAVTILGNSTSLGTMTGLVYFLPEALQGDRPNPRHLILLALRPVIVLSAVVGGLVVLGAPSFARLVADDAAGDMTAMLRTLAVVIPAWAITQTLLGATRGLGTMGPTVAVGQVLRPGGQIALLGWFFWRGNPTPTDIALAWGLPVVVGLGVAVAAVGRLGGWQHHGPSRVSTTEFWGYTRFRAVSTAMQIGLERIDVIVVSALLGTAAAGVYGSLSRYITAGNFLIFSVGQAMSTHLRRAIAGNDVDRARHLLQRTTGWVVLVAWPYFLLVATKSGPLARLINDEYGRNANILPILAFGMMISAFAGPIDLMLLMLGRSKASLAGVTLALATDLALLALLTKPFGLVGAAAAWAAGVAVQNGLASWLVHRDGGLTQLATPSLLGGLIAVVAVVPIGLATPDSLGGLLIAAAGSGVLWLTALWLCRRPMGLDGLVPARAVSRRRPT